MPEHNEWRHLTAEELPNLTVGSLICIGYQRKTDKTLVGRYLDFDGRNSRQMTLDTPLLLIGWETPQGSAYSHLFLLTPDGHVGRAFVYAASDDLMRVMIKVLSVYRG